ncbi:hypothetical protein ABK046_45455, partial [Streptomyces caeruleatus]
TVANTNFHTKVNWAWAYKQYHRKTIKFDYDEHIIIGGRRKGFIMFYVKVYSDEIDKIKTDCGVKDFEGYQGLHVTIGSIGKSGNAKRVWWPEPI